MSYALRNTLVLVVLVLLVNAFGWLAVVMPAHKRLDKLKKSVAEIDVKLAADATLPTDIVAAHKAYESMQQRWQERSKILPRMENTRLTFNFVNGKVDRSGDSFPFDFDFERQKDTMGLTVRRYNLRADLRFSELYQFIYHFEMDKRLLILTDLTLDAKPVTEGERAQHLVTLNAKLAAYSAANGSDDIPYLTETPPRARWNPFKALVTDRLPRNDEGLLEVDRAKLVAIAGKQAFLQDQESQLVVLQEGDAVYLGFLTKIDEQNARVEFTLNYGGFIRYRALELVRETVERGQVKRFTPAVRPAGSPQ